MSGRLAPCRPRPRRGCRRSRRRARCRRRRGCRGGGRGGGAGGGVGVRRPPWTRAGRRRRRAGAAPARGASTRSLKAWLRVREPHDEWNCAERSAEGRACSSSCSVCEGCCGLAESVRSTEASCGGFLASVRRARWPARRMRRVVDRAARDRDRDDAEDAPTKIARTAADEAAPPCGSVRRTRFGSVRSGVRLMVLLWRLT